MKPTNYGYKRAFFALDIEKINLRTGDSCKLSYSMYIPEQYPVKLRFSAIPEQLTMINRQIRRAGVALSASTLISKAPRILKIDGHLYKKYCIWESYCMPLRTGSITIPSINFTIEVRDPRGRSYRVFQSKQVSVYVSNRRSSFARTITSIK